MTPQVSLRRALTDPGLLGGVLGGPSWLAWRAMLLAAMGEPLDAAELDVFRLWTGRYAQPPARVEELWAVVGRRGGKSSAMAALAVYLGGLCSYRDVLAPGERGIVLCIGPDQRQSRILLDYCTGIAESTPILAQLIVSRTADQLELSTGIVIEVRSASFRRLRGPTCVAAICDEAAFWLSDECVNPDTEILNAVRPSLATTRGPLIVISSPYGRRGEVWSTYSKHYGPDGDPLILVAQGTSRDFNPELSQVVVDRALERDAASAAAEYLGQFRADIEGFVLLEAVKACIAAGVRERPPNRTHRYVAFTDPSGGSADSYTLAVAHREGPRESATAILDCVREVRPPFSPEATTEAFADVLKTYRVTRVFGDRYAGEWPREQFRKFGVNYECSDRSKSELYGDLLPLINSRSVDLLDNDRLVSQLVGLERRTGRSGKDSIDHAPGPGGRDDLANCVAGAVTIAASGRGAVRPAVIHESATNYSIFSKRYRPGGTVNHAR
jgi:hypothetical protein